MIMFFTNVFGKPNFGRYKLSACTVLRLTGKMKIETESIVLTKLNLNLTFFVCDKNSLVLKYTGYFIIF